jgi:hypothetical protein
MREAVAYFYNFFICKTLKSATIKITPFTIGLEHHQSYHFSSVNLKERQTSRHPGTGAIFTSPCAILQEAT